MSTSDEIVKPEKTNLVKVEPKEEKQTSKRSHFDFVEELPDDAIKIDSYLSYDFQNLYYSPSNDEFYQLPRYKYRIIPKKKTYFLCRSDADKTVRVSIKKVLKQIGVGDAEVKK